MEKVSHPPTIQKQPTIPISKKTNLPIKQVKNKYYWKWFSADVDLLIQKAKKHEKSK